MIELDFPACVERAFPREYPIARRAAERVLRAIEGRDLSALARHSPGLRGYDWANYLRLSVIRQVRALAALAAAGCLAGRVLDCGSYFGNFTLMLSEAGHAVEAVDSYDGYGEALAGIKAQMASSGIRVRDFREVGHDLGGLPQARFDAVLCMGVIEHVPHTPRPLLEGVDRVLKPGGLLILDTPNLAYLYNRQRLARGESIFCPIVSQYHTELPFEGHHREFTIDEVGWMLAELGHEGIEVETFCYSIYALPSLSGRDEENFRAMEEDPTCRELILAASRKPR
ncbi:MAG: class I SAM-dependent methyltransferase [Planctomycetota bacterium]